MNRLFLLVFLSTSIVHAQDISEKHIHLNAIDTVNSTATKVQLYVDLAWEYTLNENDSALIYVERALQISKDSDYKLGEAISLEGKGLYHEIVTGNLDKASTHYFDGIAICEDNNLDYATSIYHSLGVMFHTSDNYTKALEYYTIAYERAKTEGDVLVQKKCLINMGGIHSSLGDYEKAKAIMQESLTLDIRKEMDYATFANLGNLFIRQEKYLEALPFLEKATEIHPDNDSSEENLMYLIEAKAALKDSIGMKPKIERAIIEANNTVALRAKSHLTRALSNYYYAFGDYKTAMDYHTAYFDMYEQIKERQRDQTVYDLETNYQTEKKERELEKKEANERLLYIILGSLGLLLFFISFFLYKNKKRNQLLAMQKALLETSVDEKNVLLKEIHHRVKNNLQVISSLLSLQQRRINDPQASAAIQESRNRVKAMALIHQNLYQDPELIGVETNVYINKLASNLITNYKTEDKNIELKTDIDTLYLDIDTIIPLGLIINELISNSLKYAFENKVSGLINIKLKESDSSLNLTVMDDGLGLPEDFSIESVSSLGFRLITALSDKLKANLSIETPKHGTKVTLDILNYKTT